MLPEEEAYHEQEAGRGYIACSDDGSDPVFNSDFPDISANPLVPRGTSLIIDSMPGETEQLVKWMKDGEYFSNETRITVTAGEVCLCI